MQSITIQVHTTHKVLDNSQWFGNFMLTLKYTDTEQARVSKYIGVVKWNQPSRSHEFDITEVTLKGFGHDGTELEDLQNLSFRYIKTFANDVDF